MSYPKFGTEKIECAKRKCGWTGFETELKSVPHPKMKLALQNVCQKCGCDGYYFVNQAKGSKS